MINYLSLYGYTASQKIWLLVGLALAISSVVCFAFDKKRWSVVLLTAGGFCLFVFAAISVPFLHYWDERFHALVAKHCMDDPFAPKLYSEMPVDNVYPGGCWREADWCHGYVWLHKQPLFLWQIALCFKLFGVSLFTLRLPSVVMATLMIPLTYRIGSLLVDRRLGYFAALSAAFSWMMLDLVSGHGAVDHNNVCFFFYVTASLWAWCEYIHSGRKWKWVFVLAVLSGCAVLTKWLVGLLVYAVWGCYTVCENRFRLGKIEWLHLLVAVAVTMAVFLPWQIYTAHEFPETVALEHQANAEHFYLALEGHGEEANFYLRSIPFLYIGDAHYRCLTNETLVWNGLRVFHLLLVLVGLGLLVYRLEKWERRITLLAMVLGIYLFFTLAATKMPAYPFCICVAGFLSLGMLLWELWRLGEKFVKLVWVRKTVLVLVTVFFALYQLNMAYFRYYHTPDHEEYWMVSEYNNLQFARLKGMLPERTLLFNVRGSDDWGNYCTPAEAMFYTDALCYPFPPSEEDFRKAKAAGYHIAILTSHEVPEYMQADPDVQKVDIELWGDY